MAKKTQSSFLNDLNYLMIYDRFMNIALNTFLWEGLPPGVESKYFERPLYDRGQALFFQDPTLGYMVLNCLPDGKVNEYNEPVKFRATGFSYNKPYNIDNSVRILNKPTATNTKDHLMLYAQRIMEIERTMDVNVKSIKTPYIIACDEKDLLTFKNIFRQIDGNMPAVYADKNLNLNSLQVLETKAEFLCDRLADYRHDVTNEVLTYLGVNNANTDKRERLITDEVDANTDYIQENVSLQLKCRKDAAEKINEMFGLNITVKLNKEMEKPEQEEMEEEDADTKLY